MREAYEVMKEMINRTGPSLYVEQRYAFDRIYSVLQFKRKMSVRGVFGDRFAYLRRAFSPRGDVVSSTIKVYGIPVVTFLGRMFAGHRGAENS